MNPKEKAKELIDGFFALQDTIEWGDEALNDEMQLLYDKNGDEYNVYWVELAKSALFSVYEIIDLYDYDVMPPNQFWQDVKQEIENYEFIRKVIEFYDLDFKRRKALVVDEYAGIASIDKLGRVNNYNEPSVSHVSIDYLLCTLIEDEEQYLTGEMFSLQPSKV